MENNGWEMKVIWKPTWWLPWESFWSAWNHLLAVNHMSFWHFLHRDGITGNYTIQKSTGAYDPETNLTGMTLNEKEAAFRILGRRADPMPFISMISYDNDGFRNVKTIMARNLRICPICASKGYHSIWHQLLCLNSCFIHGTDLIEKNDIFYGVHRNSMIANGMNNCESYLETFSDIFSFIRNNAEIREMLPPMIHMEEYKQFFIISPCEDLKEHPEIPEKLLAFIVHNRKDRCVKEFTYSELDQVLRQMCRDENIDCSSDGEKNDYDYFIRHLDRTYSTSVVLKATVGRLLKEYQEYSHKKTSSRRNLYEQVLFLKENDSELRISAALKLIESLWKYKPYRYLVSTSNNKGNFGIKNKEEYRNFVGDIHTNRSIYMDIVVRYKNAPERKRMLEIRNIAFYIMMFDHVRYMLDQLEKHITHNNITKLADIEWDAFEDPVYLFCVMKDDRYRIIRL